MIFVHLLTTLNQIISYDVGLLHGVAKKFQACKCGHGKGRPIRESKAIFDSVQELKIEMESIMYIYLHLSVTYT